MRMKISATIKYVFRMGVIDAKTIMHLFRIIFYDFNIVEFRSPKTRKSPAVIHGPRS